MIHLAILLRVLSMISMLFLAFYPVEARQPGLDSLFQLANKTRSAGEFEKAFTYYDQCRQLAKKAGDSLKLGNSLIGMGIIYDQTGKYESAIKYYFEALAVYEKIGNPKKEGGTLKNIGNAYRQLKNYTQASSFLQQALAIQHEQHDLANIGNVMNDIGLVYMDQDSLLKAMDHFKKVVTVYGSHVREEVKAYALNNLALTCAKTNRFNEALDYYQTGQALMKKIDNHYGLALILGNFGDLYYRMKNYTKALEYNLQNLAMVKDLRSDALLVESYGNLAVTYESLGNYKKALAYKNNETALKDTIYKKETAKNYAEMEARYQNERKEKTILLLQRDKEIAAIGSANQRRTLYFLIIGIALIFIVAASLYVSYVIKQRSNKELSAINSKLKEANSSKAKLLSIISHDLRSPVSSLFNFLKLQQLNPARLGDANGEAANKYIIQSAENLLEAMEDLLIWSKSQMENFKPVTETINTGELFDEIIHLNEQFAREKNISLVKDDTKGIVLQADRNFLNIILRNLTGNAIKFTPKNGCVSLLAELRNDAIQIRVKDNGPGLQAPDLKNIFEWNSIRSDSSGLGLKLSKEFTEKLGGSLTVISMPGQGTEFIIALPCAVPV